ncbi:hypothetical protein [Streptomyces sp. Da 82-17]|uniref:hypothetical protein n=1 Tax=Streptomyces sp. Da 82-17 TaxID=3377116 RepID=UPI0038D3BF21
MIGSILALAGATAAVWSPFRIWYDGRHGRDYRLGELFTGTGVTEARAQLLGSLFLPFVFAALVTLVGLLLRSRLLVAVAGLVVLAFTVLWMVRVGQAEGSLSVDGAGNGLGAGAGYALVGGLVLLLAALVLPGRRGRVRREPEPEPYARDEQGQSPYGPDSAYGPDDTRPYDPPGDVRPGDRPGDTPPYGSGPYDQGPGGRG